MSDEKPDSKKIAEVAFEDALRQFSEGSARQDGAPNPPLDAGIDGLISAFEDASMLDEGDVEYWLARDLSKLLGYTDYRNFSAIVEKAKAACKNSGIAVSDHFVDVTDMIDIGKGATRAVEDVKLTRYACYLIAQNGDPRKPQISFAQTYFAIQARRQEVQDDAVRNYTPLSEDQRRLLLRDEIKTHNKNLASAAKGAGVVDPLDYAIFQSHGYKGLYGGLDVPGIRRIKGLEKKDHILDHMGSTELAANLFRATQTEEKLRRERIKGKDNANAAHFEVGQKVRKAIADIGGTMPEQLPPAENIQKVGRRLNKAIKNSQKKIDGQE